ncbi:MAG: iron-sulfur cluster assembly protein [Candidatus Odinarchaeum yellowstonii]|uniref:Iron-sulfur cluster assembly protein n=1 Tax=Odinarchaeota yellowstonii (strain LCB_4) TaxID=1841599 RepID=A0AAF0D107_ODILC|nr:MAG: iron-sulfur cluster assembly protein [Candidatus Odinarchaeum yellowstonii]
MVSKDEVMEVLKTCYDPEIPVNIVDLGLIYDVQVKDERDVYVKMTLTAPGCPLHSLIANEVRNKLKNIKNIGKVEVQLVWDPPWSPEMMSPEAKKILGF